MTLEEFAGRLNKAKRKATADRPTYTACCPAHDDKSPSFAVWEDQGWLHVKCLTGCTEDAILSAMGLDQEDRRIVPLDTKGRPTPTTTYTYTDETGGYLFEKVRTVKDGKKTFFQRVRHPDGNGYETNLASLNGKSKTLYRLPDLKAAITAKKTIYINEGEKAVERLRMAGLVATCQPLGAIRENIGTKWLPVHTQAFRSADVVIVADRDETGEAYAAYVAKELNGVASRVRVVQSATTKPHDDAYDHLEAGFTVDQFVRRQDLEPARGLKVRTITSVTPDVKMRFLAEPYLPEGKNVLLDADGGVGKTSLALAFAAAMSQGVHPTTFQPLEVPVTTLYLHKGEDSDEELMTVYRANGGKEGRIHFAGDDISFNAAGRRAVKEAIEDTGAKFVVVDALYYFLEGVVKDANSALDLVGIMQGLNQVAEATRATFLNIRHTGKATVGKAISDLGMGSVQFRNSHRGQLVCRWHPSERGVVVVTDEKGSLLVPRGEHFCYRRVDCEVQYVRNMPNPFDQAADASDMTKLGEAKRFLTDILTGRYVASEDVMTQGKQRGLSPRTLIRASTELNVTKTRSGFADNRWRWTLPAVEETEYDPWTDSEK
jgi:AAA domain